MYRWVKPRWHDKGSEIHIWMKYAWWSFQIQVHNFNLLLNHVYNNFLIQRTFWWSFYCKILYSTTIYLFYWSLNPYNPYPICCLRLYLLQRSHSILILSAISIASDPNNQNTLLFPLSTHWWNQQFELCYVIADWKFWSKGHKLFMRISFLH